MYKQTKKNEKKQTKKNKHLNSSLFCSRHLGARFTMMYACTVHKNRSHVWSGTTDCNHICFCKYHVEERQVYRHQKCHRWGRSFQQKLIIIKLLKTLLV